MNKEKKNEMIAKAAALSYRANNGDAPRVVAKGMRKIAEQIIAIARENNIPVREEPELIELLMKIETGDEIPEHLYQAVAEILAFVYRTNKKWNELSAGRA